MLRQSFARIQQRMLATQAQRVSQVVGNGLGNFHHEDESKMAQSEIPGPGVLLDDISVRFGSTGIRSLKDYFLDLEKRFGSVVRFQGPTSQEEVALFSKGDVDELLSMGGTKTVVPMWVEENSEGFVLQSSSATARSFTTMSGFKIEPHTKVHIPPPEFFAQNDNK